MLATGMLRWLSMTVRLAFTASLALACGGRESHSRQSDPSQQSEPSDPASTVDDVISPVSPAPASLGAQAVPAEAEQPAAAAGGNAQLATSAAGGSANGCGKDAADYIIAGSR